MLLWHHGMLHLMGWRQFSGGPYWVLFVVMDRKLKVIKNARVN